MKFKYFLRGFGIGIIFTSLVCLVAYQNSATKEISNKEIIERAKELGLVEQKNTIEDFLTVEKGNTETDQSTDATTAEKNDKTEEHTSEIMTTESQTTENLTTESQTTESQTTESQITTEQTGTTEQKTETVTITIEGGSGSYLVCQKLQELGVIEDAQDFDKYLIENGYAHRIRVGTHALTIGMKYEEIAVAISDPV